MDDFEKELKQGFLEEAKDLLNNAERCFLDLEKASDDPTIIEQIFRLAHNLKGSAGAVGFIELKDFTHKLESLLLKIKNREFQVTGHMVDLLLRCNDYLNFVVDTLKEDLEASYENALLKDEIDKFQCGKDNEGCKENLNRSSRQLEKSEEVSVFHSETRASSKANSTKSQGDENVRVSLAKIDSLLNNVGELVIMQTVLSQQKHLLQSSLLQKTISQMSKIVKEIQSTSMGLRMLPIKQTFQKMQRIVRDTSATLGKEVNFEFSGEETEFDKTVIEQLGDPLVHLIRNAVDHGIESPSEREALGKPKEGTIRLNAYHRGDKIIIEIKDDGKGLDPQGIRLKAIEKGLIKESADLTEEECLQLIFLPGFSTKVEITDVSGRGVGMDVVKTNIAQLQGDIQLESKLGEGTSFKIFLPLTLAIVDSVIISLDDDRFVIPITQISESLKPHQDDISFVNESDEILVLRGESMPVYRLSHLLNRKAKNERAAWESIALIIRDGGQKAFSLLVDDVISQQQVVVKRLGEELHGLSGFTGAAILGDGKANLILDVFELVNSQMNRLGRNKSNKKDITTKDVA